MSAFAADQPLLLIRDRDENLFAPIFTRLLPQTNCRLITAGQQLTCRPRRCDSWAPPWPKSHTSVQV